MSNIRGMSSIRRDKDDDDEKRRRGNNNRFVGGIDARGGGSGLAVQPNDDNDDNDDSDRPAHILDAVRAHATQASDHDGPIQRIITMYRDGFVVDNGPYRRLDDPANASFLMALARGHTPAELMQDAQGNTIHQGMTVGLVDKRDRDYYEEDHSECDSDTEDRLSNAGFQSFSGTGSSLGSATLPSSTAGVITPHGSSATSTAPILDTNRPTTSIQIRLIHGKRLVAKVNLDSPVSVLVQHIIASGEEGTDPYILTSGFPPQTLDNLNTSIEEAGLKGAQVIQKKIG